ncbi:uncharacterized protein EDB91DRAFT_1088366 [Suillus paluster]|uniref:uncharacterized protein n=1 Tax=Suillus paluster TaxID=48578 RepID=UPI001B86D017|nr:uncharacterized protein EDB91DRAFT_1088366 [Suillus paluster]KAG1721774.1 hypothetical protein EDB91DRAFT_1088366 [Suillus paluster]
MRKMRKYKDRKNGQWVNMGMGRWRMEKWGEWGDGRRRTGGWENRRTGEWQNRRTGEREIGKQKIGQRHGEFFGKGKSQQQDTNSETEVYLGHWLASHWPRYEATGLQASVPVFCKCKI